MAINYDRLLNKMDPTVWYSGKELEALWGVDKRVRSLRSTSLVQKKYLKTKGKTADIKYKTCRDVKNNTKPKIKTKAVGKDGALDELITAATKVGVENQLLKQALKEAEKLIAKALEATT
jgi:transposase-like protein